ncbi:MAG: glycosyltransferase family 2 protein [Planctomycetia bacterium]|nr:glycosyltransferase family 2 protein [Planctomycetia bacterium]
MSSLAISLLTVTALLLAAIPALLTLFNLKVFLPAPEQGGRMNKPAVSVLVPARNEAAAIEPCVRAILASRDVELEVVVLDDASTDGTDAIVRQLAEQDARVRLIRGRPLPSGWCGKQHACAQLAEAATHETWVFLDTDVLLSTDAVGRCVAFLDASQASLVSGFPRQVTGSFPEWMLLPLIHFVLLGFLPIARSRMDNSPGLAAGCGQLFITRRGDYLRAGGHTAIRASLHDGIKLPRAFRRAGLRTDIFDATDIASCRMYTRSLDVWKGLSKNATEGIGSPATIVPFTILLAGGQMLPWVLVAWGLATGWQGWPAWTVAAAVVAVALSSLPRILAAGRFRQSVTSVLAHPLGILVFLAIQWVALGRRLLGLQTSWRGRSLTPQ